MVVEQLEPGELREFGSDGQLSNGRGSVNENELQPEPRGFFLVEIACLAFGTL